MASLPHNFDQPHNDKCEDNGNSDIAEIIEPLYDSLDSSSRNIRLLSLPARMHAEEIECRLSTVKLEEAPAYEALSYTWGSPDDKQIIKLNGHQISITHSLYVALQHLRQINSFGESGDSLDYPLKRCVWVDALCINQEDIQERNHQVRLMWSIYSKAARVLVWLGPEQDDSYAGMEMVRLLSLRYKLDMRQKIERLERRLNEEQQAESEKTDCSQRIEEKGEAVTESPSSGRINIFWMFGEYRMRRGSPESNVDYAGPSPKSKAVSEPKHTGEGEDEENGELITDEDRLADIPFFMIYKLLSFEDCTDENVPTMWLAFQKLMERPWWRRVWVIQEVAAAKSSILVGCGTYWMDWEKFEWAAQTIAEYQNKPSLQRMARFGIGTSYIRDKSLMRLRADGRLDNWNGLMQLLASTQSYLASDPKDKVFALLGFLQSTRFLPDYTLTVEEVYEAVVKYSIQFTGNLAILLLNRMPKRLLLPSWMPDFSLDLAEEACNIRCPMGFFGADGNNWTNLGVPSFSCTLVKDEPGHLTVHGFVYDTPKLLGPIWDSAIEERQASVFQLIKDYENMMYTADAEYFPDLSGKHREESFWRTLIWNADGDRYPAPQEYSKSFRHLTTKATYNVPINVPAFKVEDRPEFRVVPQGDASLYYETFLRNGFRRRFFITSKGHLGSGPADMSKDDKVCILFGAKTPIILRKESSGPRYQLIGHAYVHGIMHGEALSAMQYMLQPNGIRSMGPDRFVLF
jgi:hypothetical protein